MVSGGFSMRSSDCGAAVSGEERRSCFCRVCAREHEESESTANGGE